MCFIRICHANVLNSRGQNIKKQKVQTQSFRCLPHVAEEAAATQLGTLRNCVHIGGFCSRQFNSLDNVWCQCSQCVFLRYIYIVIKGKVWRSGTRMHWLCVSDQQCFCRNYKLSLANVFSPDCTDILRVDKKSLNAKKKMQSFYHKPGFCTIVQYLRSGFW